MTALALAPKRRVLLPVLVVLALAIAAGGTWYWSSHRAAPVPSAIEASTLPAGFKPVDPPMPMGDYAFLDADGKTVHLSDFQGRPVLLNIWAKWCAPCLEEMPKLNRLQRDVAPGTLAVVAVAVDEKDPQKIRNFLANRRWDALKPYIDPKNVFPDALNIKSIPVTLLIDRNGFALVRVDAPVDWYVDEAIRLLHRTILQDAAQ